MLRFSISMALSRFFDGFTNTMHELISDERDFSLNVQV